jgi:hypothetical protein
MIEMISLESLLTPGGIAMIVTFLVQLIKKELNIQADHKHYNLIFLCMNFGLSMILAGLTIVIFEITWEIALGNGIAAWLFSIGVFHVARGAKKSLSSK